MLEDKHDNLHDADGNEITGAGDTFENGYFPNKAVENDELPEDADDITSVHETEGQLPFAPEELLNAGTETAYEAAPETVPAETASEEQPVAEEVATEETPVSGDEAVEETAAAGETPEAVAEKDAPVIEEVPAVMVLRG